MSRSRRQVLLRPIAQFVRAVSALLLAFLCAAPVWAQAPAKPVAPATAPVAVGPKRALVFPIENLRKPGEPFWLGDWLQEAVTKSLVRSGVVSAGNPETAAQWYTQFTTGPEADLPLEAWDRMPVDAVVQASVQPVLSLVDVHIRVQSRTGDLLPAESRIVRFEMTKDTPANVLGRVVALVGQALKLDEKKVATLSPPQPESWQTLETAYTLLAKPMPTGDVGARPDRVAALKPLAEDSALRGRMYEAMARLTLEQAMLNLKDMEQKRALMEALRWVDAAIGADSWDTDRLALKGEIQWFLKQDFQAKTEASVARLKNPANGLAYAVLGLVAGPSTGEGTEQLKQAQRVDPFLWSAARAAGQPAFQSGILEPMLLKWTQREANAPTRKDAIVQQMSAALKEGIDLFRAKRWDEASAKLQQASSEDDSDFHADLYLARILIETGHAPEAVQSLKDLGAENPQEPEITLYYGIALAKSGALEDARTPLETVLQDNPSQPQALFYLAQADLADRRWGPAAESLHALVGMEPRNEAAWFNLGVALANQEQWKPADEAFSRVLSLNPKSQSAQDWRARVRSHL